MGSCLLLGALVCPAPHHWLRWREMLFGRIMSAIAFMAYGHKKDSQHGDRHRRRGQEHHLHQNMKFSPMPTLVFSPHAVIFFVSRFTQTRAALRTKTHRSDQRGKEFQIADHLSTSHVRDMETNTNKKKTLSPKTHRQTYVDKHAPSCFNAQVSADDEQDGMNEEREQCD